VKKIGLQTIGKIALAPFVGTALLLASQASSALQVEQYLGFQSNDVNQLRDYAANHTSDYTEDWSIIDFTDDPSGFAGAIPGYNPWHAETETGGTGIGSSVNNTFFARITGDFYVSQADTYTFRTFNDDGVFLFVDDLATITDPGYHSEGQYQGTQYLTEGTHSVELFFFENGGEASLEFTLADSSGTFTHFNNQNLQVPVSEPATLALMGLSLAGLGFSRKRKAA
jgi:hypothetical protein